MVVNILIENTVEAHKIDIMIDQKLMRIHRLRNENHYENL